MIRIYNQTKSPIVLNGGVTVPAEGSVKANDGFLPSFEKDPFNAMQVRKGNLKVEKGVPDREEPEVSTARTDLSKMRKDELIEHIESHFPEGEVPDVVYNSKVEELREMAANVTVVDL